MARKLWLLAWLAIAWILWSGHTEILLVSLGVFSCLLVAVVAIRLDLFAHPGATPRLLLGLFLYLPWLLWQIFLANLHVARVILTPRLPISPHLRRVKANQATALGQVFHANSITLTPGTISLDLRDGEILVHCLTDGAAEGLPGIDEHASRLEGEGRKP